jgi:hypothetical protein
MPTLQVAGKGKVTRVHFLTEHKATKIYWGNGCIDPHILDLGTTWR